MPEQTYPVGIAGVELKQSPRKVPDGEAPPLAINEKLKVIGKDTPRLDGKAKRSTIKRNRTQIDQD